MFDGTDIGVRRYSELLIQLAAHNNNTYVKLSGGDAEYSPRAIAARAELIGQSWTITDGGLATDTDDDGLADEEELELGTDPQIADTDGNGVLDGEQLYDATLHTFLLESALNEGVEEDIIGTIENDIIKLEVPIGTLQSSYIATFTHAPNAIVKIGSVEQMSGITENNFSTALVYTVTSPSGYSDQDYRVEVVEKRWYQQAYLKAPNAGPGDSFGEVVALDGNTLVVGANLEDASQSSISSGAPQSDDDALADSGAAYIYQREGQTWELQAYLKASNAGEGDQFGEWLSISYPRIAVGARYEDADQTTINNNSSAPVNNDLANAGAVYLFVHGEDGWQQEAYLKAANANGGDYFGRG